MSDIWDSVAPNWERNADLVDAHMAEATTLLVESVRIGRGDRVLDLASGPGGAGLAAAAVVGDTGGVTLADLSPAMIAAAIRRADGLPQVDSLVCDQAAIDAIDESFDAVIVRHGLMFAEDPVAAVAEARRVLRPGGRYGAMTWGSRADNPWLGLILDAVGTQFGTTFPPPGVPGPFSLEDRERLREILVEGGLGEVEVRELGTPMRAASLDEWWERVPQLAGPLAQALAGMEPEVREEIRSRALHSAEEVARRTEDGVELAGSVLIACGTRTSTA
jgi:SAM-dependent methyltransferase